MSNTKENYPVAIVTAFASMPAGYSLTGIVEDQIRMLSSRGHHVHLVVCTHFNSKEAEKLFQHDPWTAEHCTIHKILPFAHLQDYRTEKNLTEDHKKIVVDAADALAVVLKDIPVVFTHDLVFTGWNLPYALGIMKLCHDFPAFRSKAWLHWIHSVPTHGFDWWDLRRYQGKHRLVFPNKSDSTRVAESYKCEQDHIVVIPHIKDYRSFWEFGKNTYDFIEDFPLAMRGDIIQVYPASTDRLGAKGVDKVISIFKHFKKIGLKPCLIICNQWATGRQRKEDVAQYYKRVRLAGLEINKEVIFTSEWRDEYATGIPRKMLRELTLMSNLFIYPTREESFGLVGPEAALAGVLMVNNRSLQMMAEVQGGTGIYAEFGSFDRTLNHPGTEAEYYQALAMLIVSRLKRNEVITAKLFNRLKYNWETLYEHYYAPTIAEAELWA